MMRFRVIHDNRSFIVTAMDSLDAVKAVKYFCDAGYSGYSMSNNAVSAYKNGEKPMSKWTEGGVIAEVAKDLGVKPSEVTLLKPWKNYLRRSSWHHTSKNYNKTDFYQVVFENKDVKITTEAQKRMNAQKVRDLQASIQRCEATISALSRLNPKSDLNVVGEDDDAVHYTLPVEYRDLNLVGTLYGEKFYSVQKKFGGVSKVLSTLVSKIADKIKFERSIIGNLKLRLSELE